MLTIGELAHRAGVSMRGIRFWQPTSRRPGGLQPVNHILDGGHVIIPTHRSATLLGSAEAGAVVAYEADLIDPRTRSGWSVIVTGVTAPVSDPDEQRRYRVALQPWIGAHMEHSIRISADLVTGFRIG
jgi:hypothetical protein